MEDRNATNTREFTLWTAPVDARCTKLERLAQAASNVVRSVTNEKIADHVKPYRTGVSEETLRSVV